MGERFGSTKWERGVRFKKKKERKGRGWGPVQKGGGVRFN